MKNTVRIIFSALTISAAIIGCKKDTGPQPSSHEYYQPVKIGEWYRYAVDSTWWKYQVDSGQTVYSIIENYDTDVPNAAGKLETRIKIERIDAQPRRVVGFSYVQRYFNNSKQEYTIERVDNDVRYVLFKAPVIPGDTFNRNSKNNIVAADIWTNFSVGSPGGGNGGTYDYVLRLVKEEKSDSAFLIDDYELYAFNVGLFYKERTYIKGRTDIPNFQNIPIMNRIDTGFSYKRVLVEQGQIQ